MSTDPCQNCKSASFSSHLRGETECKREQENYKQTETARHGGKKEWKRDSAAEGGLANALAFKLQISDGLPDTERERQCERTISANTNIGNGSEMEFTRACCCTGTAKKTFGLNQEDLNGNVEEEEEDADSHLNQKADRGRPTGRPVSRLRQAGRLHAGEWPSAASARLSGEILQRNCRTMNMKPRGKWERSGSFCARAPVCVIITEAVCLVGNKGLAGGGYLLLGAQDGFDDEVLHLFHQHWKTMETFVACEITHRAAALTPTILSALGGNFNKDDTQ